MRRHVKRRRACNGKFRYRDEPQARADLARIRAASTRTKVPVRAYFCLACNGWHLTSEEYRP
jgi:hypothetical protein